jgi:hypothetical protein
MYYIISDSEGSTVDSFSDERAAEAELLTLAQRHEGSGEVFFLLAYEDDGRPVGEARLAEDVLRRVSLVSAPEVARLSDGTAGPSHLIRLGRFSVTAAARQRHLSSQLS